MTDGSDNNGSLGGAESALRRLVPRGLLGRRPKLEPRTLAVESSATSLRAVAIERSAARITVVRACDERIVEGAPAPDCRAVLGLGPLPCVVALARDAALVGRIEFPTDDEAELRAMTRMALARDYAIEGVETLSDFQRSSATEASTGVTAAAAARARVDEAVGRAGAPVARVSVRVLGMLALVRSSDAMRDGTTLALDLVDGMLECTLIRDGEHLHSRGAQIPREGDTVARVLVEFRRLVAALRASPEGAGDGLRLDRIVIAADRQIAAELAAQVAPIAGCAAMRLDAHPRIGFATPEVRELACASCLPLVGLLLEDSAAVEPTGDAVDLLHPTPPIDVAARVRQRVLIAAGLMTVAALGGWTLGARASGRFQAAHDDLLAKARNSNALRKRYTRDDFKVQHLELYRALAPQWLTHIDALRRFAPDPTVIVLDSLSAQLDGAEIDYVDTSKSSASGAGGFALQAKPELRFVLDGEAADRTTADALRDALVKEKGYTVSSTGADARGGRRLEYPFAYTIRTADLGPKAADGASPPKGGGS